MSDKRPLHTFIDPEAKQRYEQFAQEHCISMTAITQELGYQLDQIVTGDMIEQMRQADCENRSRKR
jgi:hypothetical protein